MKTAILAILAMASMLAVACGGNETPTTTPPVVIKNNPPTNPLPTTCPTVACSSDQDCVNGTCVAKTPEPPVMTDEMCQRDYVVLTNDPTSGAARAWRCTHMSRPISLSVVAHEGKCNFLSGTWITDPGEPIAEHVDIHSTDSITFVGLSAAGNLDCTAVLR